jgi:hypothetical protein
MLLNEVGQEQADWYLIAKDGSLAVRVSDGLCVGEDESGLLLLNPKATEAQIQFSVDSSGCLRLQPAAEHCALLSPEREYCTSFRVEPYRGLSLWLPHNELALANDLQGITQQYNELPLTLVTTMQSDTASSLPGRGQANVHTEAFGIAPAPANMRAADELLERESLVPLLDSPIERIPEPQQRPDPLDLREPFTEAHPFVEPEPETAPGDAETLITQLPYGFDADDFTTSQPATVRATQAGHTHRLGRSSRITVVAAVILTGVAAGLFAAKVDLVEFPLGAAKPRTAFNPATPRLVLLSEAQPAATIAPEAVSSNAPTSAPIVPLPAPDITPATPTTGPKAKTARTPAVASVYRTDLANASELFDQGFITAPAQRNTVAILQRILAEDPAHAEAVSLLERCAERMLDAAVQAEQHGLDFEARNLLEEVMAFYPEHPKATNLWQRWVATQDV